MKIFGLLLAERDTDLEGDVIFQTEYPSVKRKVDGRRGKNAKDTGLQAATVAETEITSPVNEVDFCWLASREDLKNKLSSESQGSFSAAVKSGKMPKVKLCAGGCGVSYPAGRVLEGTKGRITSFWGKGEWKKQVGTATCILCVADTRLKAWRSLSHQADGDGVDASVAEGSKSPTFDVSDRDVEKSPGPETLPVVTVDTNASVLGTGGVESGKNGSNSPALVDDPEKPQSPAVEDDPENPKSPAVEDDPENQVEKSTTSPESVSNVREPFPDDKLFHTREGLHCHLMGRQAPHPSRVSVEQALKQVPEFVNLDEKVARGEAWWARIFLSKEKLVWVPWSHEYNAEALCSRQAGAAETEDMFIGRLRFTGRLQLRPGMKPDGTGGAASWGPLLQNGDVTETKDGYKITHFDPLFCHYEGDLGLANSSMAEGTGGFYIGPERREIYSGPFTTACCIAADESVRSGAPRHTSLAGLYGLYLLQHNMWVRAWQDENDLCDGKYGRSSHVEFRQPIGGDVSVCYEHRGKRLWKGSHALEKNTGVVGNHVFRATPGVVEWVTRAQRSVYPWLGDLAGRPSCVINAESCEKQTMKLVRHSTWVSLEAVYPLGEQIHFRKDDLVGRKRVLHLAYGPFDSIPCRIECSISRRSYAWDKFLDFNNVVAVVYNPMVFNRDCQDGGHPIGTPFIGNHAECLVYFDDPESLFLGMVYVFRGRPVAMPATWAADRFGDQWAHALECPNMPVMVGRKRIRFRKMCPRQISLMDMELLLALHKEDIASAVERNLSSQTPGATSSAVSSRSSVSVLFGDLQRRFLYGFTPVTQQLLRLGLGDLSSLHLGGEIASVTDKLWQEVPTGCAVTAAEIKTFTHELKKYPTVGANSYGGKNNPYIPLVEGPSGLVVKKDKSVLNLHSLTFVPHSGRHPFLAQFTITLATRLKKLSATRPGYTLKDFERPYAVSAAWVRRYYHTLVVQMAVRGMWDGKRFRKALLGGFPELTTGSKSQGALIKTTQPESWDHLTPMIILDVGNTPGAPLAGCARGAFVDVLRSFKVVDRGAVEAVSEWDPWVKWGGIGRLVADLNGVSSLYRSYKVLRFRQPGTMGHEEPRSVFNLLLSPLGRRSLFASGVHRVVMRPVYKNGWQNHMVAVVANAVGVWSLLDPDDGGETSSVTVLYGGIPGVTKVLAAFVVCAEAKKIPGTATFRCPEQNDEFLHTSSKSYSFPVAPTDVEARVDFSGFHLRTALAECLFQMGLPGLPDERHLHLPVSMDVAIQERTKQWWIHMVSQVNLNPLQCNRLSGFRRLATLPAKTPLMGFADSRASIWGPPRGGADAGVTYYAVEGVPRYSVGGATAVVLVVVTSTRHEYYCPRHNMYKAVGTIGSMGFVGPVTEFFITHSPEMYRSSLTRGADHILGGAEDDVVSTASLLDRDDPWNET